MVHATIPDMFRYTADRCPAAPCFLSRQDDQLVSESYAEVRAQIDRVASGFVALGVEAGDCVVLISENRREWAVADLALQTIGVITVPLYPSLPAAQIAPLIARVKAKLVVVENQGQLAKVTASRPELPLVETLVVMDWPAEATDAADLVPWATVAAGAPEHNEEVERRYAALSADDLATIIFTSGTTGVPKGVMLTQSNFCHNVAGSQKPLELRQTDSMVVVLPLSHVFMRLVAYLGMNAGMALFFNESLRKMVSDLKLVRPTISIFVPRMVEVFRDRLLAGARETKGISGRVARWATNLAPVIGQHIQDGRPLGPGLALQRAVAQKLVFRKLREAIGLDRNRLVACGGAALSPALWRWFHGLGLYTVQGYGLTETSPVVACNPNDGVNKATSVGPVIDYVEVKLAADKELLTRGACVMRGYLDMPEETAEVLDDDGWLHTGDLADIDSDGHVYIVGRKKEIMVLASGKNVAPVPIEEKLIESQLISRAIVFADGQNMVTALVVPEYDLLWAAVSAAQPDLVRDEAGAWLAEPTTRSLIDREIAAYSKDLAGFERVGRYALLPRDLQLEQEELTPTQKVRRMAVAEHFAAEIARLAQ